MPDSFLKVFRRAQKVSSVPSYIYTLQSQPWRSRMGVTTIALSRRRQQVHASLSNLADIDVEMSCL